MKKEIELVFENCEYFNVNADITYNLMKDNVIDNVKIIIDKDENSIYDIDLIERDITKFNRIQQCNDITQIIIDDNTYYILWHDEYSLENDNQISHRDKDGKMIIEINHK